MTKARGLVAAVVMAALLALLAISLPEGARADVPILSMGSYTTSTQAGDHPDVALRVEMATRGTLGDTKPDSCFCRTVRDLFVQAPPGLVGAPQDTPQCTTAEFAFRECPVDSQVGVDIESINNPPGWFFWTPLYNMETQGDELALLATPAPFLETPIFTKASVRTESDYGLEFKVFGIPNIADIGNLTQLLWGVPAAPAHDSLRLPFGGGVASKYFTCGNVNTTDPLPYLLKGEHICGSFAGPWEGPVSSNSPETPFTSNPTTCASSLTFGAQTVGYDQGTDSSEASYPAITGCDKLSFDPSLSGHPTTSDADSPSGLNIDLRVPQFLSPTTPSPSQIRASKLTLPEGFTINASAVDGKTACTDVEAKFGSRDAAQCPEFAKIGTLTIESSSLPGSLPGAVYLGEPKPGDRYRVFLVADGFSLHIKLAGSARLDPSTGQVVVEFPDLPQTPFQRFDIHLFGAERGLFATPTQCGTYEVKSEFVPWASELPNQTSTQFFTIDAGPDGGPCASSPRSFAPSFTAGVTDATGGAHSAFALHLKRSDGDQNLASFDLVTPPGLSASVAGIPYCPEAALAAAKGAAHSGLGERASPSCPAASQIGTTSAAAGAGSRPVSLPGKVYLAGPYKGAPLSIAAITPAVSGPYDLGTVAIRAAVRVDPVSARITTVSDPLPQMIEGIPVRLREIVLDLNRPNFTLNPTNCSPFGIEPKIFGDQGGLATSFTHFQVANCGSLEFNPKLAIRLSGGVNRRGHPAIHALYQAAPHEANIGRATVILPRGELLDNSRIETETVCTRVRFAAGSCPAGSLVGSAVAYTPLLDQPLRGPVYLRTSNHELPDLAVALAGQVDFELSAKIDSVNGRFRTTFESLPDVPVSKFALTIRGGRKGLLQNTDSLCGKTNRAGVQLRGQNGALVRRSIDLTTSCENRSRRKRGSRR